MQHWPFFMPLAHEVKPLQLMLLRSANHPCTHNPRGNHARTHHAGCNNAR